MRIRQLAGIGLALILLALHLPVGAQSDMFDPAAYMGANVVLYVEMQIDDAGRADFEQLVTGLQSVVGATEMNTLSIEAMIGGNIPGVSFDDHVAPWIGDRVGGGAGYAPDTLTNFEDIMIVLPIADADAFAASQDLLTAELTEASSGDGFTLYETDGFMEVAILTDAVVVGTPGVLDRAQAAQAGESLADDARFNRIRAELPQPALAMVYVGADGLRESVGEEGIALMNDGIELATILNPGESEFEAALNSIDWIDGIGAAVEVNDTRIDFTSVVALDATYAEPELPTASAGTRLLNEIPGDSIMYFGSYNGGVNYSVVALALLGPAIGNIFETIVASLESGATPAPTPTPPPTPTVQERADEIRTEINGMLALVGTNLDELAGLLSGEYAVAIFPGLEGTTIGAQLNGLGGAQWVNTSDPARLIEILETGLTLMNQTSGDEAESRTETFNNVEVTIWGDESLGDVLSYGVLDDDVVFAALGDGSIVTQASLGDGVLPQSSRFPQDIVDEYGTGLDALLYVDLQAVAAIAPMPDADMSALDLLVAAFNLEADGVIRTRATLLLAEE
jgi:hypothetical protein